MLRSKLILILISMLIIAPTVKSEIINRILAVVGSKIITQYEVESFNPKKVKEIYSIEDEEKRSQSIKTYYKNVLDFLVEQYTLEEIGKRYNVVVSEKEADDAIKDILKRNNITETDLQGALESEGITLAQYRWQIKMDILVTRIKSRVINQLVVITDNDIKKYIDENNGTLRLSDKYELRYILIQNKENISKVIDAIKEKGFASAASEFSEDKTAKSGGYLGFVSIEELSKDIRERLKDAKIKEYIKVESDKDVKFFYVESIKSKYDVSKEQRETILSALMETRYKDVYQSWLDKNRSEIFIRYIPY
ncbi:MAG: SurA N-terminal domain-containing protein [Calditerrivibrio sp.]|nr:SurA N-terminal domain-containing protein [Calditerrivibrio sp.]